MKPLNLKDIKDLYYSEIHSVPRDMDWTELENDGSEDWCWEAGDCSECGKVVVGPARGEERHCDIAEKSKCEGYINLEGPMMNYFYPCDWGGKPKEAAMKIAKLPLCIIDSGIIGKGLALTGGGMDLQHEIIEAYVRLGFYPPAHFTLENMSDRGASENDLVLAEACRCSARAMKARMERRLEDIDSYVKWSAEHNKRAS